MNERYWLFRWSFDIGPEGGMFDFRHSSKHIDTLIEDMRDFSSDDPRTYAFHIVDKRTLSVVCAGHVTDGVTNIAHLDAA